STRDRLTYIVVGEGPYRQELERQIVQRGLKEIVRLVGQTDNVLPYYHAADVFALLSKGEAAPIAPLEAMAMELPVVVARQRPYDELIRGDFGAMVPERDATEVARVIGSYLSEPSRGRSAGEAGRRQVELKYTWDRIAQQYLECSL